MKTSSIETIKTILPTIAVNNVSKAYRFYKTSKDIVLQKFSHILKLNKIYYENYEALNNISFSVYPGETVGIVGKNGSGKSTLLEIIAGTLMPDKGSVKVNGRIGALLELGSGFNPEYTGIENILFSAQIMGLKKKEIIDKLDAIIDFADIGDFITKPIKTYSSGMVVRLAFSVQSHTDPKVLIVDEALAVGDELFQKKCFNHLNSLKKKGVAILLVTHSCQQINKHCDRAILVNKGEIKMISKPTVITTMYQQLINRKDIEWDEIIHKSTNNQSDHNKMKISNNKDANVEKELNAALITRSQISYESKGAKIISTKLFDIHNNNTINEIKYGNDFGIEIAYESDENLEDLYFGCHISNKDGQRLTGQRMPAEIGQKPFTTSKNEIWSVKYFFRGSLWPGIYFVGAGIYINEGEEKEFIHRVIDCLAFRVTDSNTYQPIGLCSMNTDTPKLQKKEK